MTDNLSDTSEKLPTLVAAMEINGTSISTFLCLFTSLCWCLFSPPLAMMIVLLSCTELLLFARAWCTLTCGLAFSFLAFSLNLNLNLKPIHCVNRLALFVHSTNHFYSPIMLWYFWLLSLMALIGYYYKWHESTIFPILYDELSTHHELNDIFLMCYIMNPPTTYLNSLPSTSTVAFFSNMTHSNNFFCYVWLSLPFLHNTLLYLSWRVVPFSCFWKTFLFVFICCIVFALYVVRVTRIDAAPLQAIPESQEEPDLVLTTAPPPDEDERKIVHPPASEANSLQQAKAIASSVTTTTSTNARAPKRRLPSPPASPTIIVPDSKAARTSIHAKSGAARHRTTEADIPADISTPTRMVLKVVGVDHQTQLIQSIYRELVKQKI